MGDGFFVLDLGWIFQWCPTVVIQETTYAARV